jgi:hypothetical protein
MARKPVSAAAGTPLPPDYRPPNWQITAMMASFRPEEYDAQWAVFTLVSRGLVSADWPAQWKAYCKSEMIKRFEAKRAAKDMFS